MDTLTIVLLAAVILLVVVLAVLLVRQGGTVTTARMQALAQQVSGQDLSAFFASEVP